MYSSWRHTETRVLFTLLSEGWINIRTFKNVQLKLKKHYKKMQSKAMLNILKQTGEKQTQAVERFCGKYELLVHGCDSSLK